MRGRRPPATMPARFAPSSMAASDTRGTGDDSAGS